MTNHPNYAPLNPCGNCNSTDIGFHDGCCSTSLDCANCGRSTGESGSRVEVVETWNKMNPVKG